MTTIFGYSSFDKYITIHDENKIIKYIKNNNVNFQNIVSKMKSSGFFYILCRTITMKRLLKIKDILCDDVYFEITTFQNTIVNKNFNKITPKKIKKQIKKFIFYFIKTY